MIAVDIDQDGLRKLAEKVEVSRFLPRHDIDLGEKKSVSRLVAETAQEFGHVDGVVFSSYPRTADWGNRFEDVSQASWEKNILDHMNQNFFLAQEVSSVMVRQGQGSLVFFSSIYGLLGPDFGVYEGLEMTMPVAYSCIKGGVSNFVRYLANYLGPSGIRVNAICPGGVFDHQHPEFVKNYEARTPLRRMARPEDLIGPVEFLLSDDSVYITGVNLPVDGGWTSK